MNSSSPEALAVLEVLTVKISQCSEVFSEMCIGNSLNGLQGTYRLVCVPCYFISFIFH